MVLLIISLVLTDLEILVEKKKYIGYMEFNDKKSELDLLIKKVHYGELDHFSRDWIADLLGFNKHIIRKEKINKIYEQ